MENLEKLNIENIKLKKLALAGDEDAFDKLYKQLRPYFLWTIGRWYIDGMTREDLEQEIKMEIWRKILPYWNGNLTSWYGFGRFCIRRQLIILLNRTKTNKNKALNIAINDKLVDNKNAGDDGFDLIDSNQENNDYDPNRQALIQDSIDDIKEMLLEKLTPLESMVFKMYIKGLTYEEMFNNIKHLTKKNFNTKGIDNALERIKHKAGLKDMQDFFDNNF